MPTITYFKIIVMLKVEQDKFFYHIIDNRFKFFALNGDRR